MFDKLFNDNKKNIATNDLYYASLKFCCGKDNRGYHFFPLDIHVLVRKIKNQENNIFYEDILRHDLYEQSFIIYEAGKIYVDNTIPINSKSQYISRKYAEKILSGEKSIPIQKSVSKKLVKKI